MTLSNRARIILFWFTIAMMILVAIVAALTILRACGGPMLPQEPAPAISPPEVNLCPGDQQQFTVTDAEGITWEATGGAITADGLFTAGDAPGEYAVTATRSDSGRSGTAIVHVVACTPTPTPIPSPTPTTLPPTATPTAEPTTPASTETGGGEDQGDAQGDVGTYETGDPVEAPQTGVDIRDASIAPDLSVTLQPGGDMPAELSDLAAEGDVLLWLSLHEAIPDPPAAYTNWLFALDVDGNTGTGRAAGSARINPDLGDEFVVGVTYNPANGAYEPYTLVWDANAGAWADGPDVRYKIGESRTTLGFALSLDALTQALADAGGAALANEVVRGRAAAETYVGETRVIDFYPNRPE